MTASEEKLTFLEKARDWDWRKVGICELGVSLLFGVIVTVVAGCCFPDATSIDVAYWCVGWLIVLSLLNWFFFGGALEECLPLMAYIVAGNLVGFAIGLVIIAFVFGLN